MDIKKIVLFVLSSFLVVVVGIAVLNRVKGYVPFIGSILGS